MFLILSYLQKAVKGSDRPKAKFKPKPKYRNFDTETETDHKSKVQCKPLNVITVNVIRCTGFYLYTREADSNYSSF